MKPFLIEGLKFDLRIYVLVTCANPLKIFIYKDGLARFATEPYRKPCRENRNNLFMHLTNYSINKHSKKYIYNNEDPLLNNNHVAHKRSMKAIFKYLSNQEHNTKQLWERIKDIIIKTMCVVQPYISHNYKTCQPWDNFKTCCFEVLGFDVIIDENLKPWLLEVNYTPSFRTDSQLDKTVKFNLLQDTFQIVNP